MWNIGDVINSGATSTGCWVTGLVNVFTFSQLLFPENEEAVSLCPEEVGLTVFSV